MLFRGKQYKRIAINIKPQLEFKKVLDLLEEIEIPDVGTKPQNIKYALLEMINNSIRAHREHDIDEPLTVVMADESPRLSIEVRDHGPGFDPNMLPYSLAEDPNVIDVKSDAFVQYRERNNYKRFGMGLYVVRKTFSDFNLLFLDSHGNVTSWEPGKVRGTLIKVSIQRERDGT